MKNITSPTNSFIKWVVKLHTTKERYGSQKCIIEGQRALNSDIPLETILCTEELIPVAQSYIADDKIIMVTDAVMKKISTAHTPSGILGIAHIPKQPDKLGPGLICAQISDPGNMGTLIRTAVACNVSSIVIIEGCDPWAPKVVQASAGTIFKVPLFQWSWDELLENKKKLLLHALVVDSEKSLKTVDAKKGLLVVGNEAHGLSQEWLNDCDTQITLPMPGTVESLNAAVAGSIALYISWVHATK